MIPVVKGDMTVKCYDLTLIKEDKEVMPHIIPSERTLPLNQFLETEEDIKALKWRRLNGGFSAANSGKGVLVHGKFSEEGLSFHENQKVEDGEDGPNLVFVEKKRS